MAKDIFDIIIEKEYHQLNPEELAELAEYCKNEHEFLAMKQVLTHSKSIAGGPKLAPREATKQNLDELFMKTYGSRQRSRPFYFHPVFQAAAVLAIGFAVWVFLDNNEIPAKTNLAENSAPKETEKTADHSEEEKEPVALEKETPPAEQRKIKAPVNGNSSFMEQVPAEVEEESNQLNHYKAESASAMVSSSDIHADSYEKKAMMKSSEEAKRSYSTVSAPAVSVKDISVDADKSPFTSQSVTSMNVAAQKNVMNYLTARY